MAKNYCKLKKKLCSLWLYIAWIKLQLKMNSNEKLSGMQEEIILPSENCCLKYTVLPDLLHTFNKSM